MRGVIFLCLNLNIDKLAFRASISASYLSRIERGVYKKGLPISTLMKIAKALEVELSAIFEK